MQTKEVRGKLWSSAPSDWTQYLETYSSFAAIGEEAAKSRLYAGVPN